MVTFRDFVGVDIAPVSKKTAVKYILQIDKALTNSSHDKYTQGKLKTKSKSDKKKCDMNTVRPHCTLSMCPGKT